MHNHALAYLNLIRLLCVHCRQKKLQKSMYTLTHAIYKPLSDSPQAKVVGDML